LVQVSWWLLITRVIHAERLVGDTQFWTTRPYEWKKLLAAKLCFLAVFLYLPLVTAQAAMLAAAGLSPVSCISGMLFNLLLITGIVVLPLIAIATVTSSFFRMTLTLLVVLGCFAGTSAYFFFNADVPLRLDYLLFRGFSFAQRVPFGNQLSLALLFVAVCGAAIVLQYALRRVWLSRIVLLAAPAILTIAILFFAPHPAFSNQAWMDLHYPQMAAGAAAPVQLSDGRDEHHLLVVHHDAPQDGFNWVKVPLNLSPIPEGTAVVADDLEVTVANASGFTWSMKALELYPKQLLPDSSNLSGKWPEERRLVSFRMPLAIYDRFKSAPVTLHLTLALTQLQATIVTRAPLPTRAVSIPDVGVCAQQVAGYGFIQCRSAFRQPQMTYVSADWSIAPCAAPQTELEQVRGETWLGLLDSEPAEFGIVPIQASNAGFMPDHNNPTGGSHLCTGTPITFTQYRAVRHTQTSLTLNDVHLLQSN
jgi:hypothetical protein